MSEQRSGHRAIERDKTPLLVGMLAVLGAWAVVVPYLASGLGLRVEVPARVEFVDHVVPGLLVVALSAASLALLKARPGMRGSLLFLSASGLCFLAALWIVSTHVPLLIQAGRGLIGWGPALLHNSAGLPLALLCLWLLVPQLRGS